MSDSTTGNAACTAFRREDGFTLNELMIVLVIIGILALLALPRFMNLTTKAKMTEAKLNLNQVHALQQAHYFERDVYAVDLVNIGYQQSPLVTDGGTARYTIAIEHADDRGYTATATSVIDFDKDGVYNVWEVAQDGVVRERTLD